MAVGAGGDLSWPITRAADLFASSLAVSDARQTVSYGHCRGLTAGYEVPRSIELREEPLPKSGAGKLLKTVLREPFWAGLDRRVN